MGGGDTAHHEHTFCSEYLRTFLHFPNALLNLSHRAVGNRGQFDAGMIAASTPLRTTTTPAQLRLAEYKFLTDSLPPPAQPYAPQSLARFTDELAIYVQNTFACSRLGISQRKGGMGFDKDQVAACDSIAEALRDHASAVTAFVLNHARSITNISGVELYVLYDRHVLGLWARSPGFPLHSRRRDGACNESILRAVRELANTPPAAHAGPAAQGGLSNELLTSPSGLPWKPPQSKTYCVAYNSVASCARLQAQCKYPHICGLVGCSAGHSAQAHPV